MATGFDERYDGEEPWTSQLAIQVWELCMATTLVTWGLHHLQYLVKLAKKFDNREGSWKIRNLIFKNWTKTKQSGIKKPEPSNQDNDDDTAYKSNPHKNVANAANHKDQSLWPIQSHHYSKQHQKGYKHGHSLPKNWDHADSDEDEENHTMEIKKPKKTILDWMTSLSIPWNITSTKK